MKKVMSIIAVALFTATFVSCGPSAEEKAKMEENAKRIADSISNALMAPAPETTPATTDSAATTAPATETTAAEQHH